VLLTTRSSGATNQCFRIGDSKTYGFQYHIEVRHAHERETENARVLQQSGCSVSSRAWQPVLSMMLSCLPGYVHTEHYSQPPTDKHMRTYVHMYTYVCIYVYVYIYVRIHIHICIICMYGRRWARIWPPCGIEGG